MPESVQTVTDGQGSFEFASLPQGSFQLLATDGIHRQVDVNHAYGRPYDKIVVVMTALGAVKGRILNANGQPNQQSFIKISPTGDHPTNWEGGMPVAVNGSFEFTGVPPGQYLLSNGIEPTKEMAAKLIDVKAEETVEVELRK